MCRLRDYMYLGNEHMPIHEEVEYNYVCLHLQHCTLVVLFPFTMIFIYPVF